MGLCLYALHKNAVTIDAFRVALFALRLLGGDCGLPLRASIHSFVSLLLGVRSALFGVCCDAEYQHSYEFYCELCAALFPRVRFELALPTDCVRIASG